MKRRFVDAPDAFRCTARVTLRDGTTAQCGRRRRNMSPFFMDLCLQHARIAIGKLRFASPNAAHAVPNAAEEPRGTA